MHSDADAFWKAQNVGDADIAARPAAIGATRWPRGLAWPNSLPTDGEDWSIGTHFVRVPTLPEMRRLIGPANDAIRRDRSRLFFARSSDRARARLQLGMHDRGEEYIFADGSIHEADAAGHARHFPAHLKVVRLPTFQIRSGEIWDVSASHTNWPRLDYREELYVYVHVDRLIVEPGSSLEVHGNVFALECAEIHVVQGQGRIAQNVACDFEIRIRPTQHPAFSRRRSGSRAGNSGADGADGADSVASTIIGTPFGPRLLEHSPDRDGKPACDGTAGRDGTPGQNGGMTMLADIRVGTLVGFKPGSFRISAQAAAGLPGGAGGHGGHGGAGGSGADGVDGIDGVIRGGNGGRGGDGGNGGNGGRGGNGGLASNVFINIPAAQVACLDLQPKDSPGGPGGAGGRAGSGGSGGKHGALAGSAQPAPCGARGRDGAPGATGKSRPGATMHVNAVP